MPDVNLNNKVEYENDVGAERNYHLSSGPAQIQT